MNRYETHNRWEELVGFSLAVVGIAMVWGSALHIAADFPTQHSGTQIERRFR